MDRSSLSPSQLIEVLRADRWWFMALDAYPGKEGEKQQIIQARLRKFRPFVETELVQLVADWLLEPGEEGDTLHRHLVRERLLGVARRLGTFEVPETPQSVRDAVTEPAVDFLLSMGMIDLGRTRAQQWERIVAIRDLAASYTLPPGDFMKHIPGAEDWIIRLTLTPASFREREMDRVDALHPDLVKQRLVAFEANVRRNLEGFVGGVRLTLMANIPQGDQYWRFRAEQIQRIEQRIRHIWPHASEEATPSM